MRPDGIQVARENTTSRRDRHAERMLGARQQLAVGETAAALRYAMGAMSKAPGDREAALAAARKFDRERPAWLSREALVKEVVDEAVGLGPIEDLLADLRALEPVVARLGGEEAIAETFHAIQDVGRWWP